MEELAKIPAQQYEVDLQLQEAFVKNAIAAKCDATSY